MMITKDDQATYESRINYLERQNKLLKEVLLDHFAQSALASGRYAAGQCYGIAQTMLEERNKHVGS